MSLRPRQLLLGVLAALLVGAWSPSGHAGTPVQRPVATRPEAAAAGKTSVQMLVVYATNDHATIDPALGQVARYFKNLRFTGYELLRTETASLDTNDSQSFNIEGGFKVTLDLVSKDDARAKIRVRITQNSGTLIDVTASVARNATMIVAGPKYKSGVLILPLTARY